MKKFLKTVSLILTLLFSLGVLAGCGSEPAKKSAIDQIKERGKLRVAVFSDKPPFGFVDANGKNQGYDVYLAKRLAKDLLGDENKVEFVLVEAASRIEVLEADKVDITLANFTVTPERKEKVDFANPYMKVALGIVSPEGAPITSVDQLKGKKLIVNKGTTAETYFTKNYPDVELLKYDQNTEAFQALKDGRGAALAHDNTLVFAWSRENKGYVTGITKLGELDAIAPAVKKGNTELRDWINTELTKLGEEKFFHKDFEETLKPAYGDSVNPEDVVVEGGAIK
ncbi:MAG: extracellular solute-binding protein family 3 [Massilibacillus sp.]|jgi:polar amino acid transport system substrate-binding protein|nr:extracellular solute-binding protein family 3 [Massilibacillus sp.]